MDNVYTTEQVAKKLQVSVITIRRYIKAGKLSASKLGKDFRIEESDIEKLFHQTKTSKK